MGNKRIGLVVVFAAVVALWGQQSKVVGYFPDWWDWFGASEVDYTQVTHVAWSFVDPSSAALNTFSETKRIKMDALVAAAHGASVKVILSLGGSGSGSAFSTMAADETVRRQFLKDLKAFLIARSLDGVDIDWEFVLQADSVSIRLLVEEMRDTLGTTYSISAAVPCSNYWAQWFRAERFIEDMDWLGVMTYDMTGSWASSATYNSPLYPSTVAPDLSLSQSMKYWSETRGIPKEKLLAGHPFYGYVFEKVATPGASGFGNVTYIDYREVVPQLAAWTLHWDEEAEVPWATNASGNYVTWNDGASLAIAARWVRDNGYAGSILWDLSADYYQEKHWLLDSVGTVLLGITSAIPEKSRKQNSISNNIVKRYNLLGQRKR